MTKYEKLLSVISKLINEDKTSAKRELIKLIRESKEKNVETLEKDKKQTKMIKKKISEDFDEMDRLRDHQSVCDDLSLIGKRLKGLGYDIIAKSDGTHCIDQITVVDSLITPEISKTINMFRAGKEGKISIKVSNGATIIRANTVGVTESRKTSLVRRKIAK